MALQRRVIASVYLVLLAPWVFLTLTAGGIHDHSALTASQVACGCETAECSDLEAAQDLRLGQIVQGSNVASERQICLACLWQLTTDARTSAETLDPCVASLSGVPIAASSLPLTLARITNEARAPPRS